MEVAELKKLEKSLNDISNVIYTSPCTCNDVKEVEKLLDVIFPTSYKHFLLAMGVLQKGGDCVAGISGKNPLEKRGGTILRETLELRKNYDLPKGLAVVENDEDEYFLCLDLRDPNVEEPPILEYNIFRLKLIAEPVFCCFDEFLKDWVNNTIDVINSVKQYGDQL